MDSSATPTASESRLSDALAVGNSADDPQTQLESKRVHSVMRILVGSNKILNDRTHDDALRLLRYARPALLHSTKKQDQLSPHAARCDEYCSCFPHPEFPGIPASSSSPASPLHRLPVELKEYILSFLSPHLSAAQRIRIFQYAASASTLPQLLPCLPSLTSNHSVCIPDPSNLEIGDQNKIWKIGGGGLGSGGGCAGGKCLGSSNALLCHKERDREEWLFQIGCDAYEPDG
ncbi:hypothetical protein H0H93_015590 [Arthromyces matolae]|nr:hypothetical protein H0H93_015590 [Arthromyces matolae]